MKELAKKLNRLATKVEGSTKTAMRGDPIWEVIEDITGNIDRGISDWIDCDWTHTDDEGEICEGGNANTCSTCEKGDADAKQAGKYGEMALKAIKKGDFKRAYNLVEQANELQLEWGDNPSWSDAVESFWVIQK